MKTITKNQKYYGVLTLLFSVAFFYYLYSALETRTYDHIWIYAIVYGSLLFAGGLYFGYRDSIRESRKDLGFQYHLTVFMIVNLISVPWLFIVMGVSMDSLMNAGFQLIPWGLGLLIHYFFSSKSIKGISKQELFD